MVIVVTVLSIGLALALQVVGAIGVLFTVRRGQWSAPPNHRYEQEAAQHAAHHAAARDSLRRYRRPGPRNNPPTGW
jgi:hypothetical protein